MEWTIKRKNMHLDTSKLFDGNQQGTWQGLRTLITLANIVLGSSQDPYSYKTMIIEIPSSNIHPTKLTTKKFCLFFLKG